VAVETHLSFICVISFLEYFGITIWALLKRVKKRRIKITKPSQIVSAMVTEVMFSGKIA
jgi:hypothetical protein